MRFEGGGLKKMDLLKLSKIINTQEEVKYARILRDGNLRITSEEGKENG